MLHSKNHGKNALGAAAFHLLASALVLGLLAVLVFGIWFPASLRDLTGGTKLFWMVVSVVLVCGPLLTLVVFNNLKSKSELRRDLALVGCIQLLALGYGVHALSYARPLALVYELDRFRVVSFTSLDEAEADQIPSWAQPLRFTPLQTVGLRAASSAKEQMASMDASLQGIEPSQRPSWWQDYSLNVPQILQHARPLTELQSKHLPKISLIDAALAHAIADAQPGETVTPAALRWMPLVSSRVTDWVVLLDPATARVRGYVHLDGF